MSTAAPAGYITIAPWIMTRIPQLLEFIETVFDGEELARVAVDDGSIRHAEIRI